MLNSLDELLAHKVQKLYDTENRLVEILPRLAAEATNEDLKQAIERHLQETQTHVRRLEEVARELGISPHGESCGIIEEYVKAANQLIEAPGVPAVKDVALIGAAQAVEHFEIAAYGTTRSIAKELGKNRVADLLQETLDEEGDADEKLSDIAEGGLFSSGVNREAAEMAESHR